MAYCKLYVADVSFLYIYSVLLVCPKIYYRPCHDIQLTIPTLVMARYNSRNGHVFCRSLGVRTDVEVTSAERAERSEGNCRT